VPCAACDDESVTWLDDAPPMCDNCYAEQILAMARFEPEDDPQPTSLLLDSDATAIDSTRVTPANVARIVNSFVGMLDHLAATPRGMVISEADVLASVVQIARQFTAQQIGERVFTNPTAATLNRASIVLALQTLIDEIVKIDLPSPTVN
jgi:hypothetical protein